MMDVVRDGDEYRERRPGEDRHGTLQVGPGPVGGFVRFVLDPERIERVAARRRPRSSGHFASRTVRSERTSESSTLPSMCGGRCRSDPAGDQLLVTQVRAAYPSRPRPTRIADDESKPSGMFPSAATPSQPTAASQSFGTSSPVISMFDAMN